MSREEFERNMMPAPFLGMLSNLGMAQHEDPNYFNTGTLGWSVARLFLHYERIVNSLEGREKVRSYIEADIEAFIIRLRIALNDLAYLILQMYPEKLQGFPGLSGDVHPRDKEVSLLALITSMEKSPDVFPEFLKALGQHKRWIIAVKNRRDLLVHYKQRVTVFSDYPVWFMFISAVGVERASANEKGVGTIRSERAFDYVNCHLSLFLRLLNVDMVEALRAHIERNGIAYKEFGENPRIGVPGISEYKRRNRLDA